MSLTQQKCEACRSDAPRVTDEEMEQLMKEIPEWAAVDVEGVMQISRTYKFKDFRQALEFSYKVGELAEDEGHHPEIVTEWGRVRVRWWTHAIKGLHTNDFICAAKTDQLLDK